MIPLRTSGSGALRPNGKRDIAQISELGIVEALKSFADECSEKDSEKVWFDPLIDTPLQPFVRLQIAGLLSLWGLVSLEEWMRNSEVAKPVVERIGEQVGKLGMWGDSATPYLIFMLVLLERLKITDLAQKLYSEALGGLTEMAVTEELGCPPPYYNLGEVMERRMGIVEHDEDWQGASWSILPLIGMAVWFNYRPSLEKNWPELTKLTWREFRCDSPWERGRFRNESGINYTEVPDLSGSWKKLEDRFDSYELDAFDQMFRDFPVVAAAAYLPHAHRLSFGSIAALCKTI